MEQAVGAITETLLELRNQNALIRQANVDARQAEKDKHTADEVSRAKREWVNDEAAKIEKCEGLPAMSMRNWLRSLKNALKRIPLIDRDSVPNPDEVQEQVNRDLGRKLMTRTARGELTLAIDEQIERNPAETVKDTLIAIEEMFLGADEQAALKSELEELRQQGGNKAEHQIPAYCRFFRQKADQAYGIVDLSAEDDSKLAELFITSLYSEEIARELFEHDPQLVKLETAQTAAIDIYNRNRRMTRAWKGRRKHNPSTRRETPMEIGQVDNAALQLRIAQLEAELASLKTGNKVSANPRQNKQFLGPRIAGSKTICFECKRPGHFARDCAERRKRLSREATVSNTQ